MGARVGPRMGAGALAGAPVSLVTTLLTLGAREAFLHEDITGADYAALGLRAGVSGGVAGAGGAGASALTGFLLGSEVPVVGNLVGAVVGLLVYWGSDTLFGQGIEDRVRGWLGDGPGCGGRS